MTDSHSLPVRKIPIGTRSITGTMPGGARFESTLERDLMYILRFDLNVDKYVAQPVKIEYKGEDGRPRSYTPDILIHHRKDILPAKNMPSILAEVKYRANLRENFAELRPKFKAAIHYAKEHGWKFKIITEREIRTPYMSNAKFLLGFLNPDPYPKYEIVQMVLDRMRELRETDVDSLLTSIYRDKWNQAELLPIIWHLIAIRRIGNDLTLPITMRSKIWQMGK